MDGSVVVVGGSVVVVGGSVVVGGAVVGGAVVAVVEVGGLVVDGGLVVGGGVESTGGGGVIEISSPDTSTAAPDGETNAVNAAACTANGSRGFVVDVGVGFVVVDDEWSVDDGVV